MELGLSLGDASKPFRLLPEKPTPKQHKASIDKGSLDFYMSLGLNSTAVVVPEKTQKSQQSDDDSAEGDDSDNNQDENTPFQLTILPVAPIPRLIPSHLQSLPWYSDNGSSENGSSGNMVVTAARGLDVNRIPAVATVDEVSSANSMGSPFSMYRNGNLLSSYKRSIEGTGNVVVEVENRGSDDDENGFNKRKKLRLSKDQSAFLEESFKEHNTLNPKQKLALAKQLNLRPRQVEVWFQNRRARTKLKQTEVDCEYLKKCCETLTEENRRLNKELQELRALKTTSNPFYMQLPATTLTMCPSCERVATTSSVPPPPTKSPPKAITFPLTRPRFYPFSQTSNHQNQPAAS